MSSPNTPYVLDELQPKGSYSVCCGHALINPSDEEEWMRLNPISKALQGTTVAPGSTNAAQAVPEHQPPHTGKEFTNE